MGRLTLTSGKPIPAGDPDATVYFTENKMFRNGQWVKFVPKNDFPGAFHSSDGRVVGIFVAASRGDGNVGPHPAYIALVDEDGDNLMVPSKDIFIHVKLAPLMVDFLESVTDRRDIPHKRVAHMPDGWNPEP